MQVLFVSNFINHHQVYLADALYANPNVEYHFIETTPMPAEFAQNGYPDYSTRPYVLKTYESTENMRKARQMIDNADIVMFGVSPTNPAEWLKQRISQNKVTFHYSERWFKRGIYRNLLSRQILYLIKNYTLHRNKRLYMLCASAYTHIDAKKVFAFPNKCFKWGYFTKTLALDIDNIISLKQKNNKIKLLFVARFIKWKHPNFPVKVARHLKDLGIDFEVNMYGAGPELDSIRKMIEDLDVNDCVNLCGILPNDEILKQFQEHDIFLFTSDKNEGWGAVANEAMSNGCIVVGSNKIGSVPFLIEHKKNGMIFQDQDERDLLSCILYLINNPGERAIMTKNAYRTMHEIWSPENAANNFVKLAQSALDGKIIPAEYGPCSRTI